MKMQFASCRDVCHDEPNDAPQFFHSPMSNVATYSVESYGSMVTARVRTETLANALRAVVNSDTTVLDIGTGTGLFALLACQFGARRVFAIEPADGIQVARELAIANGFADRIEFFQDVSNRVTLPECANVLISDIGGLSPLFQQHIASIADARERLLTPNATLITQRDQIFSALVSSSELYERTVAQNETCMGGLDTTPASWRLANTMHRATSLTPDDLVSSHVSWAVIDYTKRTDPNFSGPLEFTVSRGGSVHGFCVWYDRVLSDGNGYSHAPGAKDVLSGCAFLPWPRPVELAEGDTVQVNLSADLVENDYVWRWKTRVSGERDGSLIPVSSFEHCAAREEREIRPSGEFVEFEQSTFNAIPFAPEKLRKRSEGYRTRLNSNGRVSRFVLERMEAGATVGAIAQHLVAQFPARFDTTQEALDHVRGLSEVFSE
ncbi:MAG: 50S ribosomal protein L11 methyltransferase [Planctomycetota bacterium]